MRRFTRFARSPGPFTRSGPSLARSPGTYQPQEFVPNVHDLVVEGEGIINAALYVENVGHVEVAAAGVDVLWPNLEAAVVYVLGEFLEGVVELVFRGVKLPEVSVQLRLEGVRAGRIFQDAPVGQAEELLALLELFKPEVRFGKKQVGRHAFDASIPINVLQKYERLKTAAIDIFIG